MSLVTIIIPMFNEIDNIRQCVEVLRKQKNQNFDVIFVDDGSSDSTVEELSRYLDPSIVFNYKIIKQTNKGAAAARLAGIKIAVTEFIMLFDCDDDLSDNITDEVYSEYKKDSNVDIIIPNMRIQNINGDWNDFIFYTKDLQLKPIDCVKESLKNWGVHGCYTIRRDIINGSYTKYYSYNVKKENYVNNDEVITRLNFSSSKKIVRTNSVYYYKYNHSSTTKRINNNKYLSIKNSVILSNIYSNEIEIKNIAKSELISVLWGSLVYMRRHKDNLDNINEWKKTITEATHDLNYIKDFKKSKYKRRVQLTILKFLTNFNLI